MATKKIYIILGRVVWTLLFAGVVFLVFTAMRTKQNETLNGMAVQIEAVEGKIFINEQAVKNILAETAGTKITGSHLSKFDLRKMESRLQEEVWIANAELYIDNKNLLHVKITERVPVARIFDVVGSSYYLDNTGSKLPLSTTDRADLPVFTNIPVSNKNNQEYFKTTMADILAMANIIRRDEFWNAQAAAINLVGANKYELYPAIGFHVVEWGTAANTKEKLEKLKIFYQQILAKKPLAEYSRISVAYTGQIVAVRGDGVVPGVDAVKAAQVFKQLVNETRKKVNDNAVQSEKENGRIMPEYAGSAKQDKPVAKPKESVIKKEEVPAEIKVADTAPPKPKALMPIKSNNN